MPDLHGALVSISETASGSMLDTSASSGATTLSLYDASDFDEDGGFASVAGTVYTYDSVDMVADTIHLTTGLTGAQPADTQISIWDADNSSVVTERTALVIVDGQGDGDPLIADVDHSLHTLLTQSTQAQGQSVTLVEDGDGYRLTAVHGKNNEGSQITTSTNVQYGVDTDGSGISGLVVVLSNGSVRVSTLTDVRVKTPDNSTFKPILASAFTVSSDSAVKTKPTKPPDALAIIRDAPAKHWRYLTDEKSVKRLGPMADDLPEWLSQYDEEEGHLMLDLARQNGVLWRAVEQLMERVERLEGTDPNPRKG